MVKGINNKDIRKNVSIAMIAQAVSLATAFIFNLIVPKYLSVEQYSCWQTFALYLGYVGILHFGLLDGLMLRYSHLNYDELDKPLLRSQFVILLFLISLLSLGGGSLLFFIDNNFTKEIILMVSIGIFSKNLFTYNSYVFQLTNRINNYAFLIIIHRLIMGGIIFALILLDVKDFIWYCLAELIADIVSSLLCSFYNQGMYLGKLVPWGRMKEELILNIHAGIQLLIANWASMLLIGSARMIIQWHYDLITFGKVSFAFSLTNLFLSFITSISIVLFPSIKRIDDDNLPIFYVKIRKIISPFLFSIILFYFPVAYVLSIWLPDYNESFFYLGVLLPMIVYSSKVMLLTNNYLKAFRKENIMLKINIVSMIGAVIGFIICAYIVENIHALIIWVLLAVGLRSILSEIVVSKIIKQNFFREHLTEVILTIIFVIAATCFNKYIGSIVYLIPLIIYLIHQSGNRLTKLFSR